MKNKKEKIICPYVATDIVIEYNDGNKEGVVLITRKNYPLGLALPGGFAEKKLTLERNAAKEGKEETGLDVKIKNPKRPFYVSSDPDRDPREHVISVAYIGIGTGVLKAGDDAKTADVYSPEELMNFVENKKFVLGHEEIIMEYLKLRGFVK